MEIQWLREFIVLAQALNYRSSAEKLFISQSTLSKHIAAIEHELDTRLFVRDTKSVRLTREGSLFLESARAIVREYDFVSERISNRHIVQGSLHIAGAIRVPLCNAVTEPVVAAFEEKYPNVKTVITDIQWQDYREKLLKGIYDIVITVDLPNTNKEGLESLVIGHAPLCAWVSRACKLAEGVDTISMRDLSKLNLRILDPEISGDYVSYLKELMSSMGIKARKSRPLSQMFSMGPEDYALTPHFDPSGYFGYDLRVVELEEQVDMRFVVLRKRSISNPVAALFFDELRNAVSQEEDDG